MLAFYQQYFHLEDAIFTRIEHEDALVATVYQVTLPNETSLILKICERPHDYLREVYFLNHFAGRIPVPNIIKVVEPNKEVHGAILMERLTGHLPKKEEITASLAQEMGHALALIHSNRMRGYGDPVQELHKDPRVYFTFKFEEGLEECKYHLPSTLIEKCQQYYQSNLHLLDSVDGPCIVHRDFRPGNLFIHQGKLQGIIDWAGARASFAEEDFCTIEHGEWLSDKKAFLSSYATIRPLPHYEPLIPFLRLNKAIATIGFTVKKSTWNNRDSCLYQYNRQLLDTLILD